MAATTVKGSCPGPDEWHHLEDLNERRRVQNRLSQRNRRSNLRTQLTQSHKREPPKKSTESKQGRPLVWVPPNSSTARGRLPTTETNNPESPHPPDPVASPDRWPDLWDGALLEKPSADAAPHRQGDTMDSSWIDTLMRSPDDGVLGCGPPMTILDDTNMTFDAAPIHTSIAESNGVPAQRNVAHIEGGGCKVPQDMQSAVQPQLLELHPDRHRVPDCRDPFFGYAPLHVAASRGHLPIVQLLTERGMPVDQLSSQNETALHLAAKQGHVTVAQYLLERGAEPHKGNQHGQTALHVAAEQGHCDVVRLLFGYLPDVNVLDCNGHTALHRAVAEGHVDVVRAMLEHGMDAEVKVGWPLNAKSND